MLHAAREPAEAHPSLREDHLQHGGQQQGIGARPDGEMFVRRLGGLGAARVDDDHAPPARPDAGEAAAHVGSAHQAAVGNERIGADDEEEVGPVHVRHRDQPEMSEHAQRGQHLRKLVGGARRVDVARPECPPEGEPVGQQPEVVGDGIAVVEPDRIAAVPAANAGQPAGGAIECLVPGGLAPVRARADEGRPNPLGIVVQIGERRRLRTYVAAAERIVGVAADRPDALAVDVDQQTAHRLAERAGRDARRRLPAHVRNAEGAERIAATRPGISSPRDAGCAAMRSSGTGVRQSAVSKRASRRLHARSACASL